MGIDGGRCALSSILSIGVGGVGIFSLSIGYTVVCLSVTSCVEDPGGGTTGVDSGVLRQHGGAPTANVIGAEPTPISNLCAPC
jgi:hypothetical protein